MSVFLFRYLHSRKIIHRDLKSLNVLVGRGGVLKICDFGLAKLRLQSQSLHTKVGTPLWMAPEVMTSGSYSYSADIYSLALIFYEITVGKIPYQGLNQMQLLDQVGNGNLRPPFPPSGFSLALQQLIEQCWDKNPSLRPSIQDVVQVVALQ